jgi:glycosyltransferase involved in cell wall biosynthesis
MLSVVIPTFKDPFLQNTIDSVLNNSVGDIEVIPVFDGYKEEIKKDDRVKPVYLEKNLGMRGAINAGLAVAKGEYLMKCDSHCAFGKGYDKILIGEPNWLVIPRRYSMDEINWTKDESRAFRDYHYYSFPKPAKWGMGIYSQEWTQRTIDRWMYSIDNTMSFQGSCWFANRDYFMSHVGFLDGRRETYGGIAVEQAEVGLKYWLNGGAVKVNKKIWYAHLHKMPRHYAAGMFHKTYKNGRHAIENNVWAAKHWMNNEEPGMKHHIDWLIQKFWPIPDWPEDWKIKWLEGNTEMKFDTPLCELAYKYRTDKCPQIYHKYTPYYYKLLKDKRESAKKVIELGIGYITEKNKFWGYPLGSSLFMWRDFFPNAQIYGVDIVPTSIFQADRITTYLYDERKKEDLEDLIKKTGNDIDLFIDDGSHKIEDQVFTAKTLLPMLKRGVIYIVEDVPYPDTFKRMMSGYHCHSVALGLISIKRK